MKRVVVSLIVVALNLFGVTPRGAVIDDNWAQWRGPDGLGVSPSAAYPDEWAPDKNIAWKTPVPGRGHSSPIVWKDRIFLTTSIEGGKAPDDHKAPIHLGFDLKPGYYHADSVGADHLYALKVLAFDAKGGKLLWEKTVYDGAMYDNRHSKNTYASSTMATDGSSVYAFFESGGLYAFDFDGKLLWKKSLGGIAKAGMGPGTSPVIYENLLILQCDQEMGDGSFIVALDRKDGTEVWRQARKTRRSWATPLIVRTPARVEMVTSGAEVVISYDPKTGKELWRANGTESHPIPSPVAGDGLVFLSAGSSGERAMAIKLGGDGDLTDSPAVVWRYRKGAAYVPSPILRGEYFYLMSDTGHHHVHRSCDRQGRLRRRPSARAGDVHRFARRLWRPPARHERRRRHVCHQGRPDARDPAHQQRRRAGVCVVGAGRRHHLRPRRPAPVCNQIKQMNSPRIIAVAPHTW